MYKNELIAELGLRALIKEDFINHRKDLTLPGFRALAVYRYGTWARSRRSYPVRACFSAIHLFLARFVRNYYGIELYYTANIGRRLHIGHQSGIVVHEYATIGDDCVIRQGVTLGIGGLQRGETGREHAPMIGNRVDFGVGAVIIGKVTIGDDVNIGPNVVILTDIKSNSTVMASPPRVLSRSILARPDMEPEICKSNLECNSTSGGI
ncbi:hypothetical protein [Phyllobacterium sp. SB3]|uniref:serine O-acetyltransferase n=1 Tax=Phyllobacterium sp. SB3 TaxID=3156073 RepID=UPI0032AF2A4A